MRFGKIRIEDGNLIFTKHMMSNTLPCRDILWAYEQRERDIQESSDRYLLTNSLVIVTRRKKQYHFEMSGKDARECILLLQALNGNMAVGFPNGGRIPLNSALNTRDLGAIETLDGRHIRPRMLLRSGDLYHLSQGDQETLLEDYHLKKVIDLRTTEEIRERPDTVMPGVEYFHLPVLDEEVLRVMHAGSLTQRLTEKETDPREKQEHLYETLISDQYSVGQFATFLDILLGNKEGAVLWHSSTGKDRAGIASALLLSVLGVSRKIIRKDFVRSNVFLDSEMRYMERYLAYRGDNRGRIGNLQTVYRVEEVYLNKVFYTIDRDYGSMAKFIKRGLCLNPSTVEEIKEKYLL